MLNCLYCSNRVFLIDLDGKPQKHTWTRPRIMYSSRRMSSNASAGVAQPLIIVELGVNPLLGLALAAILHLRSYGQVPLWLSVPHGLLPLLLQRQRRRFLPMRHAEAQWDTLAKDQLSAPAVALADGVVLLLCKFSFESLIFELRLTNS
jgi:hypothetical protein